MNSEKKKKCFGKKLAIAAIGGLLCGAAVFAIPTGYNRIMEGRAEQNAGPVDTEQENQKKENLILTSDSTQGARESSVYDVSAVWNSALPSVVIVNVKQVSTYRFLGRVYEQESSGSGTGVIFAQGDALYVATNHHVIDGATTILLTFADGTTAPAEVKGSSPTEDIAVLAVKYSDISESTLKNIRIAALGNSDSLKCGDMVIAIGNAAGQGLSLTVGYVSALDREIELEGGKMTLLQTDAAINPGNSGGPLLNAKGELIGINNAKLVKTSVEGVGYAIPVNTAALVINQLLHAEEIEYKDSAYLGVKCQDVTETLSEALDMPVGVYIAEMTDDSPAAEAGIPLYAVIVEVNGISVKNEEQLREVLAGIRGGSEGTVVVQERIRGEYTKKEYKVTYGKRKDAEK